MFLYSFRIKRYMEISMFLYGSRMQRYMEISMFLYGSRMQRYMEISMFLYGSSRVKGTWKFPCFFMVLAESKVHGNFHVPLRF